MLPKPLHRSKVVAALTARPGPYGDPLELEQLHLGGPGQVAAAAALHEDHVLDAHRPSAGVIEPRLDRDHVAGLELGIQAADPRQLVDVEADPVTGAVEEALVPAVDHPGHEPPGLQRAVDLGVDGRAGGSVADQLHPPKLAAHHRLLPAPELVRALSLAPPPAP